MGVLLVAVAVFFSCREPGFIIEPVAPQAQIEPRFEVRVLMAEDARQCTLRIRGNFSVLNSAGVALIPDTIFTERGVPREVSVSAGLLNIGDRSFSESQLTILPDESHIFALDGNDYRGKLVLKVNADGQTFDAINVLPMEQYLAGVVGAEMPNHWEMEALKAQAIAARTYCLYNMRRYGAARDWDVTRTAASQVYNGLRAESTRTWQAVNDTIGEVLTCRQNDAVEEIFPTYYSSSCGGHTEDAKNVFGDDFGPLCGVDCPYCKNVARPNVFFWPMVQFDKAEVTAALQWKYPKLIEIGDITDIVAVRQSDYNDFSRLTFVKLIGAAGKSDFVRAEDLRLTIDPSGNKLRSTNCKIVTMNGRWAFTGGRGFGHGVGMCQCGAEGMARQGKTAEEILSHYYPGSKIARAY
jgi:stage II sporulation protein D